jgi:hypothetical protein
VTIGDTVERDGFLFTDVIPAQGGHQAAER